MPLKADPSEIEIVTMFRSRCQILCPGVRVVGIPNAGKRSQWAAAQAKREGLVKGFPDVICLWRDRGIAMIEFKTAHGKLSIDQEEWLDRLNLMGFPATVARSADDALAFLRAMGAPFMGKVAA